MLEFQLFVLIGKKLPRPYSSNSIEQLEELTKNAGNSSTLQSIAHELTFRRTRRANRLASNIQDQLNSLDGNSSNSHSVAAEYQQSTATDIPPCNEQDLEEKEFRILDLEKLYANNTNKVTDPVVARLTCWSAIEVLSPQTFRSPEDLSTEGRNGVAKIENTLPWQREERSRKSYKLYYEVILGAIDVDLAEEKLVSVFGKDEEKQRPAKTKAVIASVLVEKNGNLVEDAVSVSSFSWGLPLALKKKLDVLSSWPQIEGRLKEHLFNSMKREDKDGNELPLDKTTIMQAYHWLLEQLQIPLELARPPEIILRRYHYFKSPSAPECSLLNSFFIEDLSKTIQVYNQGGLGEGVKKYLGLGKPNAPLDLLMNEHALECAVAPQNTPSGRWPMGSDKALALLQQAAVNIVAYEDDKLLAINGPPGTGKTTLLRDIISNVVVNRASELSTFDNPLDAFSTTGIKVPAGEKGFWHVYSLSSKIKGHELLVASSNNAAVENISHELPDKNSIAREEAAYFRTVSDALAKAAYEDNEEAEHKEQPFESWGLIAAALGNMKNRAKFQKAFWWDEDAGMRWYLKAAKGDNVVIETRNAQTGETIERRARKVVVNEDVPDNSSVAIQKWEKARTKFLKTLEDVEKDIHAVEQVRKLCVELRTERKKLKRFSQKLYSSGQTYAELMPDSHFFNVYWPDTKVNSGTNIDKLMRSNQARPHWIFRILPFRRGKAWNSLKKSYRQFCNQRAVTSKLRKKISDIRQVCGETLIDETFFNSDHEVKQTAKPWLPEELHKKREDLFLEALAVHKAFIDVSAQKILHNISALFSPDYLNTPEKKALLSDLWSTLFLVVPVISTTFASVSRMLGDLPPESLGWLLIDEAGQALPQAAVGAIMRAKKSVVVGDPVQIPPVVTLPDRLSSEIFKYFNVDKDLWSAPKASSQTLSDRASTFQSFFETDLGRRLVGMPLLVHRRCEDPMFSISNSVAYNNYMVSQVKPSDGGLIRNALGPSRWICVDGEADNKWCPAEGEAVIQLFKKLNEHSIIKPDIFIVTPFRVVAHEMRRLLRNESTLLNQLGLDASQFSKKCVGTVHTVQGREADTVILLLGAPMSSQHGARQWAGSPENLINVAVSRAKRNLYVVGSHGAWSGAGCFTTLAKKLPYDA